MSSTKVFPCNTCDLKFETSQAQRTHMREPWHVYNLKRRMADLPPIAADTYAKTVATHLVSSKSEPEQAAFQSSRQMRSLRENQDTGESSESEDAIDDEEKEGDQTNTCLFCTRASDNPETNLGHMSSEHGLYIPQIEHLSSLETIVNYLRFVVTRYNECLYCGVVKQSTEGARRHMLDKGHCMINLEREPELLEFYEFSDSDGKDTGDEETPRSQAQETDSVPFTDVSQEEYALPSGKIVTSKSRAREARLFARRTALANKENSGQLVTTDANDNTELMLLDTSNESTGRNRGGDHGRTIAVRDAMGLTGISGQQMRSLVTVHRKMQRQQAVVNASRKWADELGGTHQKHYKQKMNLRDG